MGWTPHVPKFGIEPNLTGLANLRLNENDERDPISRFWGIGPLLAKLPDANLFLEFRVFFAKKSGAGLALIPKF